ncbi:TetR/AcrR family transcriptional regulator [Rhodococcus sp. NPDC060090]|uniref:TetR/AcrR family transcriptional regulator n=1 Tax=Rhodococcus sp. NPDC060090 TaxID=3347056 RepID=UPI00364B94AA
MSTTPRLSMRERQRNLTRQSILDASLEAFAERGYFATTVDDIVQRAGIGRATFYLHFDGKATVLRNLRDARMVEWQAQDGFTWGHDKAASVRTFFERMVDFYLEAPILYKTLHEARAADPEFAAEHMRTMEELVVEWSRTKTAASTEQLRLSVAMLYSMLDYFMHLWLIQGWDIERERAIDAMSEALLAAMR